MAKRRIRGFLGDWTGASICGVSEAQIAEEVEDQGERGGILRSSCQGSALASTSFLALPRANVRKPLRRRDLCLPQAVQFMLRYAQLHRLIRIN